MTTGTPPPTVPKRSRARTFVPLGIAAWLVLEIWLLTVVAGATSGLTVLLLLVGGFVLGAAVIKRAGRRAFQQPHRDVRQQQSRGRAPPTAKRRRGQRPDHAGRPAADHPRASSRTRWGCSC